MVVGEISALNISMGHEAPEGVSYRETAPGAYSIEDLVFTMPGVWQVRLRAEGDTCVDEAAFGFEIR